MPAFCICRRSTEARRGGGCCGDGDKSDQSCCCPLHKFDPTYER